MIFDELYLAAGVFVFSCSIIGVPICWKQLRIIIRVMSQLVGVPPNL